MDLKDLVRDVQDFPTEGIVFKDITTVLKDPQGLKLAIDSMAEQLKNVDFDLILGPESRGFIFGMPLAYNLNKGFVLVRKPGKLPSKTISKSYDLEYGSNTIEMHVDAIKKGQKVVIVDDLLATGGTCEAIIDLVKELGGEVVKLEFFIELEFLKGREKFEGIEIGSVIKY